MPEECGTPGVQKAMTTAHNPNLVGDYSPVSQDTGIPADGAELKAYLSRPEGLSTAPGIIVIHENKGLVPYVRDVAEGLASAGYIAVAPDLLSREGGTDSFNDPEKEIPPKLRDIPRERHISDVQAVVDWLKDQPGVSGLGIVGFCFGGGIVWGMVTSCPDLKAAVPFYGANPPLEEVPDINAAVYAVYGALDERINPGIEPITEAMKTAGKTFESKVYPYAVHAFHNHTNRAIYNAAAARMAWSDSLRWLDTHLNG